ncbi:potassium channel subfamily K member 1 [Protobothrops mucrosquamatus]|uniref:potassium channel subfamily K member 1 n=1 Tax=Protobothrops mucrosquamatus TaxID=103944 RepID=UPI000775AE5C|nr:potassium channel subfamily K member 1 [Protobothrops mucrosquamatus]
MEPATGLLRRPARFGLLLAAYGLFLLLGAVVFAALEAPAERALLAALRAARASLLAEHRPCLAEHQLAGLLRGVLAARGYGAFALGNGSADPAWEFTSALFFAASALTTTGYGNMVPLSDWGKIISILYCFVGIPVTILFVRCLLRCLLPVLTYRPVRYIHSRWGFPWAHVALGHSMVLGLATLTLFILIPAICFWILKDNWTFLESIYFCFISLSTIGLGDFVPRVMSPPSLHGFYELSITCYLLTGVLAMLVTLETVYQLKEVRALIRFFAPSRSSTPEEEDRVGIVSRDQLALTSDLGRCTPRNLTERGDP